MKNKYIIAIIGLLIVIAGIFAAIAAVNKTLGWHSSSTDIRIIVDGSEKTLQQVIDENLFTGTHSYASISSPPSGGHSADRIWVSVNGVEKTLINALNTTGLYGNKTTLSYAGPSDKSKSYHYATEIEVTICGSKFNLQEAVDSGKIAYYSWVSGPCSAICNNGTRTITCQKVIDGVQVDNACCNPATKPSTTCNPQSCMWGANNSAYGPPRYSVDKSGYWVKDYQCSKCVYGSCDREGGVNAHAGTFCSNPASQWTCCTLISKICNNFIATCK